MFNVDAYKAFTAFKKKRLLKFEVHLIVLGTLYKQTNQCIMSIARHYSTAHQQETII